MLNIISCGFHTGCVRVFDIRETRRLHEFLQHQGPVTEVSWTSLVLHTLLQSSLMLCLAACFVQLCCCSITLMHFRSYTLQTVRGSSLRAVMAIYSCMTLQKDIKRSEYCRYWACLATHTAVEKGTVRIQSCCSMSTTHHRAFNLL